MQTRSTNRSASGFSVVELMIAMTLILVVMGLVGSLFSRALTTRQRESSRTDALTAAQAALNIISRELANSGYGLVDNGIVYADSNIKLIHFRANLTNHNAVLTDPGEDITYFFDPITRSILRSDANGGGIGVPQTSVVVNRISDLDFQYYNYEGDNPIGTPIDTPSFNTGRVRVRVQVLLENVFGQPNPQSIVLVSDVTLRNSDYMLRQY